MTEEIAIVGKDYSVHMLECSECKRKIFVGRNMFGVSHQWSINVTCAGCLIIDEQWAKANPETAEEIREWMKDVPSSKV